MLPSLRAVLMTRHVSDGVLQRLEELENLIPWGVPEYAMEDDQLEAKLMRNYLVDRIMDGKEV